MVGDNQPNYERDYIHVVQHEAAYQNIEREDEG
jgi:hypothetical protein